MIHLIIETIGWITVIGGTIGFLLLKFAGHVGLKQRKENAFQKRLKK